MYVYLHNILYCSLLYYRSRFLEEFLISVVHLTPLCHTDNISIVAAWQLTLSREAKLTCGLRWFILNGVSLLTQERKDQSTQPRRWTQVTGECDNTGKISVCSSPHILPSGCYASSSNVSGARLCQARHHSVRVIWEVAKVSLRLLRWLFTCQSQKAHPQSLFWSTPCTSK